MPTSCAAVVQTAKHLGLELGTAPVIAILDELYGRRPEPWLAAMPTEDPGEEVTRVDETPVLDPARSARGTLSPDLRVRRLAPDDEIRRGPYAAFGPELHTPPTPLPTLPLAAPAERPSDRPMLRSLPIAYVSPPRIVIREAPPSSRRRVWIVALALAAVIGALARC